MTEFFNNWLPFIYLYGVGGMLFLFGLVFLRKTGAIDIKKKRHRFWFRTLIFGYFYFFFMHFIWTIAALYW